MYIRQNNVIHYSIICSYFRQNNILYEAITWFWINNNTCVLCIHSILGKMLFYIWQFCTFHQVKMWFEPDKIMQPTLIFLSVIHLYLFLHCSSPNYSSVRGVIKMLWNINIWGYMGVLATSTIKKGKKMRCAVSLAVHHLVHALFAKSINQFCACHVYKQNC